jgi:hypothetical protein
MIDRSRKGRPVHAPFTIRTAYKTIPGGSTGTIAYEIDNGVGKRLIEVIWNETGEQSPVFPEEVEVLTHDHEKPRKGKEFTDEDEYCIVRRAA